MVKCKVFRTDWNNKNDLGPVHHFNKFCEENPNIEIIHIDTLNVGINNSDLSIFLFYKESEHIPTYCNRNQSTINNPTIKKDDLIYYADKDEEIIAKIIQTDPINDRVTISFKSNGVICQAHISYKQVAFVPDSIEVRNFKPGDSVIYGTNCKEYNATILRTYKDSCIIEYAKNIVETRYCYIEKVGAI